MTRKGTWTNNDGLVVGFGANLPERQESGVYETDGRTVQAHLAVTFQSTLGASGAKITVPAGSFVKNVYLKVGTAWVGGTSLAFGDATTPAGFITATQAATANLTAGAVIQAGGAYAIATGTSATAPKPYAAATDLYFTLVGTYTAGDATVVVEYAI